MSALVTFVQMREAVEALCAAIDRGEVQASDQEILALATHINDKWRHHTVFGPVATNLIFMLAARSKAGRAELKRMAQ